MAQPKKTKTIIIKQADKGIVKKSEGKNRLLGNVIFEHDGALMHCDSAWLYREDNRIEAFENVKINQGDTLFLWGDYLEYSGDTKMAKITGEEVKLQDPKMTLITDRLDYDRKEEVGYYYTGGVITNDENRLTSREGYYHSNSKQYYFKDSVVLTNPEYVIESDTLIYNSDSRFAYFHGPTTITSDSSYIYCENGVYNTVDDIAQFEKNAYLYDENKYLTGDSLYYEKKDEFGEAFENVLIHDTVENYVITGGYGRHVGRWDSTFMTIDPIYSIVQDGDTLHIHGDTLFSTTFTEALPANKKAAADISGTSDSIATDSTGLAAVTTDSIATDSVPRVAAPQTEPQTYRLLKVFRGVRFYKSDLQGKSDSLTYNTRDSVIRMYYDPLVWSDSSQVSGDTIYLTTRNEKLDSLKVYSKSFIISQIDPTKYNQIKGRKMFGKFSDNDLRRVYVNGNGQTIYFPKDEKKEYIGMNHAVCSNILIKLKDNEVNSITFLTKPEATMYPMPEATSEKSKLEGFVPRYDERPESKQDLLIK